MSLWKTNPIPNGELAIHRQRGAELPLDAYNVDLAAAD